MDPWETFRRVAADRRSGAAALAARTADALCSLESDRDVLRAARRVLRAHAAMAPLWRVFDAALRARDSRRDASAAIREQIEDQRAGVARVAAGWALPRRAAVATHSASDTVLAALERAGRTRVVAIACTASMPGGEGRALAARLRRLGFDARVVADATMAQACAASTVALVGADAITPSVVVNKVGTLPFALSAREAGIACYVLAGTGKLMPDELWNPERAPRFEATPLEIFDAVVTERGPMRAAGVRRAASRIRMDPRLEALAG